MSETPPYAAISFVEPRTSPIKELIRRRRLTFFALALVVELGIFFGALAYPIDPAQQQALLNQANGVIGSAGGQGTVGVFAAIFGNNLRVALLEMIPVAGAAMFAVSIFTTGQVVQALAISNNLPAPVFGLALFFFPFAIVELSAYAVAVASGSMLLAAWRRKTLRAEVRVFGIEAALVVVAVLVAAAMETVGIVNPFVSLALWLPTAVGLVALVFVFRSGQSRAPSAT